MPGDDAFEYGELLVLQHDPEVPPARLTEVLDARAGRRPWRLVQVATEPMPSLEQVRGVIVLGGVMGVHDTAEHPWLDAELGFLRTAVEAEVPVFGVCLGGQLLATALGGTVTPRERPQLGFLPLERTADAAGDPVFAGWPDGARATFMHGDQVTALPEGTVEMLTGADGSCAWRAAEGLHYGIQFHPEADAALLESWAQHPQSIERFGVIGADPEVYVAEARRREPFLLAVGLSLVGRWIDTVVGRNDPAPPRKARAAA